MKRIMVFVIIFSCAVLYSQENKVVMLKDSVNIRAILQKQIEEIRSKEEHKSVQEKSSNVVTVKEASSESQNIFIKIFILTDISLGVVLFVLWRRRNIRVRNVEKSWLKKNVIKLREDRITSRENNELSRLRKQLRLEPICNSGNPEYVSQFAKKQSISKGELMLAARLNSYKRVKDADSAF